MHCTTDQWLVDCTLTKVLSAHGETATLSAMDLSLLRCTALHCNGLHCTALHLTALKCTVHSIIKDSLAGENAFQIFEHYNCMESICLRDSCILVDTTYYEFWNVENLLMAFNMWFIAHGTNASCWRRNNLKYIFFLLLSSRLISECYFPFLGPKPNFPRLQTWKILFECLELNKPV